MPDRIRLLELDNAWTFFQAMTPANARLESDFNRLGYLYRGVDSDKHDLLPSAFRPDKELLFNGSWTKVVALRTNRDQMCAELEILVAFLDAADRQGLALPEDSQLLRQVLEKQRHAFSETRTGALQVKWPPPELWSVLAIAQHSGVPTRLLDWTWEPRIAAYFAAKSALTRLRASPEPEKLSGDKLAVWATAPTVFSTGILTLLESPIGAPILRVSPPFAGNDNLRAQQGAFLLYFRSSLEWGGDAERSSYTKVAQDALASKGADPSELLFVKLTLPVSEAPDLLLLLRLHGIHAASVFPGFRGAAESLEEKRLLPTKEQWRASDSRRKALAASADGLVRGL